MWELGFEPRTRGLRDHAVLFAVANLLQDSIVATCSTVELLPHKLVLIILNLAGTARIELTLSESKSLVLPLDDIPIAFVSWLYRFSVYTSLLVD